jgi:hypothetical protein
MRIWAKTDGAVKEGKYLVVRRDGTVPHWPHFVIGARDMAAPLALLAYADIAERMGYDPEYVQSIRELAQDFREYMVREGAGDPEAPPHRKDDPYVIDAMRGQPSVLTVKPDKRNYPK